jgi:hypothetical protein
MRVIPSELRVEPPQQTSTTEPIEVTADRILRTTLRPFVAGTTDGDTEFTGTEPIDYVLTLSTEEAKKWVVMRLAAYQEAMVHFVEVCLSAQSDEKRKPLTELEWEAIAATDGLTRAVPQEQVVYKWIMERDDMKEQPTWVARGRP